MTRHADERIYEEKDLNPTQKKNRRVDEQKNLWAAVHGIPLIRIKEKDINERPAEVMAMLKEKLRLGKRVVDIKNRKKRRHVNNLGKKL